MTTPTEGLGARTGRDTPPDRAALGTPIAVFQPSLRSRVVIAACGAGLLAFGTVFALFPSGHMFSKGFWPYVLASFGALILLVAVLLWRQRLAICPGGVIRVRGRRQECCRWDEIGEIVVGVHSAGRLIRVSSPHCSLLKRDGTCVDLLALEVGQFGDMVNTLRQSSAPHGISWKEEPGRFDWMRWVGYVVTGLFVIWLIVGVVQLIK
jgi:hypothetical protein